MFLVRPRVFDEERVISEFYKNERIACELSQPHTMAQGDRVRNLEELKVAETKINVINIVILIIIIIIMLMLMMIFILMTMIRRKRNVSCNEFSSWPDTCPLLSVRKISGD